MNLDAYLSRKDAALVAGVAPRTLEKWRDRGWVSPEVGRRFLSIKPGKGGTFRYRLGDVMQAAEDTGANPRSPGREVRVLVLS